MKHISKTMIMAACRILGVHISANKDELKIARNRLAKIYHPDKHPYVNSDVSQHINNKFNAIQDAYQLLLDNHEFIIKEYSCLPEFILTSKEALASKAHWIYTTVEQIH